MNITAEQIIGSHLGKEFSDQEATRLADLMDMRELSAKMNHDFIELNNYIFKPHGRY